mgnify:CR=1 FL=1
MALSFPYPKLGTIKRAPGEGCSSCVHREYCQAFYWLYRYAQYPSTTGKNTAGVNDHLGIQCASWSDNINDRITTWTQDDLEENERLAVEEQILIEPFSSGIDDPVTASQYKGV